VLAEWESRLERHQAEQEQQAGAQQRALARREQDLGQRERGVAQLSEGLEQRRAAVQEKELQVGARRWVTAPGHASCWLVLRRGRPPATENQPTRR
jgi:hypothetical protein